MTHVSLIQTDHAALPLADTKLPDYFLQLERVAAHLTHEQLMALRRARVMGMAAHAGQTRKSGEPYITHPVAVACVLADLGMDVETH